MASFDPQDILCPDDDRAAVPLLPLDAAGFAAWEGTADESARRWAETAGFAGKRGTVLTLPGEDGRLAAVLIGLGSGSAADDLADPWLWAGVAERVPGGCYRLPDDLAPEAARLAALGWALAHYRFGRYRREASAPPLRVLLLPAAVSCPAVHADVAAIARVRDLVNTPTSDMGPAALAAVAEDIARTHGARVETIVGDDLLTRNLPAIHAVGRAAAEAPRLIDLIWGEETAPKVTLVGKGVCFDTGGLDLKGAKPMRLMKKDMGGAAHVLGLAGRIMAAGLPVRLRVLIPAVENAVSGNAYRPGDIIATRKGFRIEIDNTDAEGRLVLADALALADEEAPDLLVDFATLTGAARVALGPDLPALFTPDEALATALADAAARERDPLWRLPLWQPYLADLESPVADMANAADSPFAGAITAALFLGRFVERARAWAHFDIYAWNRKTRPGRPAGGEAMALRSVFAVLAERFAGS